MKRFAIISVVLLSSAAWAENQPEASAPPNPFIEGMKAYQKHPPKGFESDPRLLSAKDLKTLLIDLQTQMTRVDKALPESFKMGEAVKADLKDNIDIFEKVPYCVSCGVHVLAYLDDAVQVLNQSLVQGATSGDQKARLAQVVSDGQLRAVHEKLVAHIGAIARQSDLSIASTYYPDGPKAFKARMAFPVNMKN